VLSFRNPKIRDTVTRPSPLPGVCADGECATFLFTDIEGSTRLWDEHPVEMQAALERHDEILRISIEAHDGYVFSTAGDTFSASFAKAGGAISAATDTQRALERETLAGGGTGHGPYGAAHW
jgi:class 3 adenylate cyclase